MKVSLDQGLKLDMPALSSFRVSQIWAAIYVYCTWNSFRVRYNIPYLDNYLSADSSTSKSMPFLSSAVIDFNTYSCMRYQSLSNIGAQKYGFVPISQYTRVKEYW
jgi:hypothetical protein